MPAGMTVYNDSNYIQISDAFKTFVFVGKGTVALGGAPWSPTLGGGSYNYGAHAQIVIPNTTGYAPMLALRCGVHISIFRLQLVGSNWVWDIISQLGGNQTNVITWYAFTETPNVVPNNYGLEVRAEGGALCYHSGYRPLMVRDYQSQVNGNSGVVNIGSGTLAIALLSSSYYWSAQVPAGTWQQFLYGCAIRTTGNSTGELISNLQYGQLYQPANFGYGGGGSGQWAILAVDVTGY
jgi:hypothetical protein